ncbi:MAG: cytochrome c peroxidase [Arenicella sp.]
MAFLRWSLLLSSLYLPVFNVFAQEHIRLAPGDDKTNYSDVDYKTDSLSLEQRIGRPADLLKIARSRQMGLPPLLVPKNNTPDSGKIALGRKLFFDRRLSLNKTMSCAMCHVPEQGFTNNELARPIGFEGRGLKRNAPTLLNAAYYSRLFFDQREFSLEQQVWSPLLASNEMNNPSIGYVVEALQQADDYAGLFEQAFKKPVSMQTIGLALAQYERALISGDSRFDRWLYAHDTQALNNQEILGYQLFIGRAGCSGCHLIQKDHALFTDNQTHNTGIGYQDSMLGTSEPLQVQLAPGISAHIAQARIASVSNLKPNDLGRYEVTLDPNDRWRFRTPILRNVALTAPYMHNGELLSLEDVIDFYNLGGIPNELLSPLIKPLNLKHAERAALVAFLKTLTGKNVKILVSDAFSVPIGDPSSGSSKN